MKTITSEESHYVLQTLLSRGAVRLSQIMKTLHGRADEIRSLRERLASLEGMPSRSRAGRPAGRPAAATAAAKPGRRAKRKMSPKVRALRRLQGRYMGLVRGLKPAQKARVRSVREKQGMGAAISLASSLAGKS